MAVQWFITAAGREQGPYTSAQVKALVDQDKIHAATMIRRSDMAEAVPAGNVNGLLPAQGAAAAPVGEPAQPPRAPRAPASSPPPVDDVDAYDGHDDGDDWDDEEVDEAVENRAGIGIRIASKVIDSLAIAAVFVGPIVIGALIAAGISQTPYHEEAGAWADVLEKFGDDRVAFERFLLDHGGSRVPYGERFTYSAEGVDAEVKPVFEILVDLNNAGPEDEEAVKPDLEELLRSEDGEEALEAFVKGLEAIETLVSPSDPRVEAPLLEKYKEVLREQDIETTDAAQNIERWEDVEKWRTYFRQKEGAVRDTLGNRWAKHFRTRLDEGAGRIAAAQKQAGIVVLLTWLIAVFLLVFYDPFFEIAAGGSPGKRMLGTVVVDDRYRRVGVGKALLRHVLRMIPLYFITAFFGDRQGLHDKLTNTQVVPSRIQRQMRQVERRTRGAGAGGTARTARRASPRGGNAAGAEVGRGPGLPRRGNQRSGQKGTAPIRRRR